jgi:CubicO group peptidase (beta-lactamase class C family)
MIEIMRKNRVFVYGLLSAVLILGVFDCSENNVLSAQTKSSEQKRQSNDFNKIEGGEIAQKIAEQFEKQLRNFVVGYSFCWVKDGKPIAKGGIGWSRAPWEKENPSVPMTVDTVHHIASVSKTVTAAALLKVMQEKKIDLDTPIYKLLGKDFKEFSPRSKKITVRQILNHTSGFNFSPPEVLREPYREHLAELLAAGPPREPGGDPTRIRRPGTGTPPADETRAVYSGINFWLARAVLEDLSGLDYEPAVRKYILEPANLKNWTLKPQPEPRPPGYSVFTPNQPGSNKDDEKTIKHFAGNAGWHTNACGLAQFGYALNANKGIPEEVKQQMFSDLLGIEKVKSAAGDIYFHDGVWLDDGKTGFETGMVIFPDGFVGVAMFNTWGNWFVTKQIRDVHTELINSKTKAILDDISEQFLNSLLELEYQEFDQTMNSGWRKYSDAGRNLDAAKMIDYYLTNKNGLTGYQKVLLNFHSGQHYAFANNYDLAVKRLSSAKHERMPETWNSYVDATIAFLRRDRKGLLAIRDKMKIGKKEPDGTIPNLDVVERLVENFDLTYEEAYKGKKNSSVIKGI